MMQISDSLYGLITSLHDDRMKPIFFIRLLIQIKVFHILPLYYKILRIRTVTEISIKQRQSLRAITICMKQVNFERG